MGKKKDLEKRVLKLEKKIEVLMRERQRTPTFPIDIDAISHRIQELIQKQIP